MQIRKMLSRDYAAFSSHFIWRFDAHDLRSSTAELGERTLGVLGEATGSDIYI